MARRMGCNRVALLCVEGPVGRQAFLLIALTPQRLDRPPGMTHTDFTPPIGSVWGRRPVCRGSLARSSPAYLERMIWGQAAVCSGLAALWAVTLFMVRRKRA
jgi:hypothetical protein